MKEIKNNNLKVELINSCSNDPGLYGNLAFGSLSTVKILEGKFKNEIIYVAELCQKTNYTTGNIYELVYWSEPSFSAILCDGKSYNSNWNLDKQNQFYLTFGILKEQTFFLNRYGSTSNNSKTPLDPSPQHLNCLDDRYILERL